MKTLLFVLLALSLFACGGGQAATPPATPASPPSHDTGPLPTALGKPRVTVEYVVVHEKWVEKTMTPNPADVTAWYETAEGKAGVPARRERFDFQTKKDAEAALAKAKKGVPLQRGAVKTDSLVAPEEEAKLNAAFDKLAMGEAVVVDLAKDFFVVLKKDRPSDDAIERAFKKAKAPETSQRVATALLSRFQKTETDARAAIAEVVGELLGERAVADPDRPAPVVIDDDRFRHARLAPKAKDAVGTMLKTANAGETVGAPIVDGPITTVARALPPTTDR